MEVNALFELVASSVGAGDFERGGGDVGGMNFGLLGSSLARAIAMQPEPVPTSTMRELGGEAAGRPRPAV